MSSYRKHSAEFKAEAVRLALSGEKPKSQVARELWIADSVLDRWIELYGSKPDGEPAVLTPNEREELLRLRREHQRLQEEHAILKKPSVSSRRNWDEIPNSSVTTGASSA